MATVLVIAGGGLGMLAGIVGGLWLGGLVEGGPSWRYWALNIVFVVAGVGVAFGGLMLDQMSLVVGAIAFEGAGLTGLKYGYGQSVGLWRVHDRAVGTDNDLLGE